MVFYLVDNSNFRKVNTKRHCLNAIKTFFRAPKEENDFKRDELGRFVSKPERNMMNLKGIVQRIVVPGLDTEDEPRGGYEEIGKHSRLVDNLRRKFRAIRNREPHLKNCCQYQMFMDLRRFVYM